MKTNPIAFLKQVRAETAKVTWPTRRETVISTIMVFVMVTVAALFFFCADQIYTLIFAHGLPFIQGLLNGFMS